MTIERFQRYTAKVTPRPEYRGMAMKPEVATIAGEVHQFRAMWLESESAKYPGEWVFEPVDTAVQERYGRLGLAWLAEGDLTIMEDKP